MADEFDNVLGDEETGSIPLIPEEVDEDGVDDGDEEDDDVAKVEDEEEDEI